ncbi:methyl-accepting chemotaxis protein [Chitinolyticbacter meiyuanensis]|uniref:methyl-accepting chemotaxis protein n=1 Tax=Chitinolyticbacter meiyuanensis TaxID=682798 RepID=UPI00165294A6|nr:methyl-accepting chemotaxis protein [Chitinolyticbacter meiyuanensis]
MKIASQLKVVSALTVATLLGLGAWIAWQSTTLRDDFAADRAHQQAVAVLADMHGTMLKLSRLDPLMQDAEAQLANAEHSVATAQAKATRLLGPAAEPVNAALTASWARYLQQYRSAVTISAESPEDALSIPEQIYRNDLAPVLEVIERSMAEAQARSRSSADAIAGRMARLVSATLLPLALTALLIVVSQLYFARKLRLRLAAMAEATARLEAGDLTGRMREGGDEIGELARAQNRFLDRLSGTLAGARRAAVTTRSEAAHVTQLADATRSEASRQAQYLADIGGASSTLRQAVGEIADQADAASSVVGEARGAVDAAHAAGEATLQRLHALASEFGQTESAMRELDGAIAQIVQVAASIGDIAKQTNLLALNAAIEAARAGETGRGFAVVADEVRKLSLQTAEATQRIDGIMGSIRARSDDTLNAMGAALVHVAECRDDGATVTQALTRISHATARVDGLMESIAAAVDEQGHASAEISARLASIGEGASQNMASTEAMLGDMRELAVVADDLEARLSTLRFREG